MSKFINYLKESYTELTKKVTWPTWDKLQNSALLVLGATLILSLVVFVMAPVSGGGGATETV